MLSESFDVVKGLRQGCVLSPVLFSLYTNSLVDRLREAGIGVECRGRSIPALLCVDDMVILADDEMMLTQEWPTSMKRWYGRLGEYVLSFG